MQSKSTAAMSPAGKADLDRVLELLKAVIQSMVDAPDEVRLESVVAGGSVNVDVYVDEPDIRFVLGRAATTKNALQQVFRATYGKLGRRLNLYVVASDRA